MNGERGLKGDPGPRGPKGKVGPPSEALRQEVEALNATLTALYGKMELLLTKDEATETFPTREESTRVRKRVALTILTSVFIALLVTMFANNFAITRCFLSGSSNSSTVCNTLFPGYNKAMKVNNERLDKFDELLQQIPSNKVTNDQQAKDIAEIRRIVNEIREAQR